MVKKRAEVIFTILLIFTGCAVFSQPAATEPGKIEIIQDSRIPVLIERHILVNATLPGVMEGYRIQIYFDSGNDSKKRAMDVRADFVSRYPGIPAYLSFQEPVFKVRIGDYRLELEADGQVQKIMVNYPNSYVIRDRINFPVLGVKFNEQ